MTTPLPKLDLPGLQRRLDALGRGESLSIAITDVRRMFGLNDVAHQRMALFAEGHGCTADPAPSMVTFHKMKLIRR